MVCLQHSQDTGSTRDIKIPDMFSIQYMHINSENQYINKIGKCYLKTMDVSYGGDKFVTYNEDLVAELDGVAPQKTTINLTFQEIEIMDRSNIEQGSKMYFAQFPTIFYDAVGKTEPKIVTHLLKRVAVHSKRKSNHRTL